MPILHGQGVVAFNYRLFQLKGRKNGGFRANPLAKFRRLSFLQFIISLTTLREKNQWKYVVFSITFSLFTAYQILRSERKDLT